ncbi:hydantoinase B/oxoprolinase family protein [Fodinicurvata sediminis]|uniref:hydantoinase B/oxoprolinase family protein n=1 Tax=Fodinicurvata sediminis TaxID=1121832 RepID=UPI0004118B01|nr:hydantoinase B/oxoprolinase family protein [Fodinicurvata sediminis]
MAEKNSLNSRFNKVDPITVEVIHNNLRSVSDETYVALMKSAYSTNIKERHDHSTCIMDADGNIIVQAEKTQAIHLTSMLGNVRSILDRFSKNEIYDGDIFISNDPYAAHGSHLPDVNFAMPIFHKGELVAFSCNIAHHADIGGMAPGSMSAAMRDIYQEGVRIPLIRLFEAGVLNDELFRLLLLNVRMPDERRGDYYAQVAACRLGARRMKGLFEEYGTNQLTSVFDQVIHRTEMRMHEAIKRIPDGAYYFEDVLDDDGAGTEDIYIRLSVTVSGEKIFFDFEGTAGQVIGNFNCPYNATVSAVCYAMKALLDPNLPNNQGMINAISVRVPEGSVLNPYFPAAVAFRAHTTQRVVDTVIGSLAGAIPDRVIAASNGSNTTAIFSGTDPRTNRPYLYLETLGGGCGARAYKDGKDGVQQHIANTANLPVEAIETEYPLQVVAYGFAADTGGAGEHRGGLALCREIRPIEHTCEFTGAGERFRHAPWGLFGGKNGTPGEFRVRSTDGTEIALPGKPHPMKINSEETAVMQSPGAGGYGNPDDRLLAELSRDLKSGKFTREFLCKYYGKDRLAQAQSYDELPDSDY